MKVASTVLRRGLHREMGFLSDVIPLIEHIKIVAKSNPFDSNDDDYFTKRYFTLKLRNNFSY